GFRRLKAYRHLPALRAALAAHQSPNELNTTLTPHSIIPGDACFAYFNKIWGIPRRHPAFGFRAWNGRRPLLASARTVPPSRLDDLPIATIGYPISYPHHGAGLRRRQANDYEWRDESKRRNSRH